MAMAKHSFSEKAAAVFSGKTHNPFLRLDPWFLHLSASSDFSEASVLEEHTTAVIPQL